MGISNNCDDVVWIVLFIFIILIVVGGCTGGYYCHQRDYFTSSHPSSSPGTDKTNHVKTTRKYNPLYTNNIIYTEPSGDVQAMAYVNAGQGTKGGGFLPLQGNGAQVFMENSDDSNHMKTPEHSGEIGGGGNYTEKEYSDRWIGFNNFPSLSNRSKYLTNSYTIQGSNKRVCNPGQKCPGLPSQMWWPSVNKLNTYGYTTQDSDAMAPCKITGHSGSCRGTSRFIKTQNEPEWKKV